MEILCLLDMTEIPRIEIASAGRVEPRQMRWVVPLLGSYGFFETLQEWKNLVEIVDIYEQRYYVSCADADELVALLRPETAGGSEAERPERSADDA